MADEIQNGDAATTPPPPPPPPSQNTHTGTIKLAPIAPGTKLPGAGGPTPLRPASPGLRPTPVAPAAARPIPSPTGSRPIPSPTSSRPLGAPLNTNSRPLGTGTRSFSRPAVTSGGQTVKLGADAPAAAPAPRPMASQTIRLSPAAAAPAAAPRPAASSSPTIRLNAPGASSKKTIALRKGGETPTSSVTETSSGMATNSVLQDPSVRFRTRPVEAADTGGLTALILSIVSILVLGVLCFAVWGQYWNLFHVNNEERPLAESKYIQPIATSSYQDVYHVKSGRMDKRPEKTEVR